MSMLLLPELARETAASNQRIARSVQTAATRSEELRQGHEKPASERQQLMRTAREALRYTLGQAAEAQGQWQDTLSLLGDGLEANEARDVLQAAVDVLDSWFVLLNSTRDLLQVAERSGAAPEGREDLDAAQREMEKVKAAADEMRAFLGRAWPPVDPALLDKARQAITHGKYKTAEAIRAGFQDRQA
jgi:hypothetical protein